MSASLLNALKLHPFATAFPLCLIIGTFSFHVLTSSSNYSNLMNLQKPQISLENYVASPFSGQLPLVNQELANFTCDEQWPDLDLFLTSPADKIGEKEYNDLFLPSYALFWPRNHTKFVLITDKETRNATAFVQRCKERAKRVLNYEPRAVLTTRAFASNGWHKSQWLKFWADNFTTSEYVGFVDTDSVFVTRVTLYDLFVDGKPVIRPVFGRPKRANPIFYSKTPGTTLAYTGFNETFNCMSFFPVIVKRAHLAIMRERIWKHSGNATFDEAFETMVKRGTESEYNLMCTMMWNMFRDDYYWVINESEPGWRGTVTGLVTKLEDANITKDLVGPRPMLTAHWSHQIVGTMRNVLRQGVCFSMTDAEQRPAFCKTYPNRYKNVNAIEFQFETDDFSKRPGALQSHLKRLAVIDRCPHPWPRDLLALI